MIYFWWDWGRTKKAACSIIHEKLAQSIKIRMGR